MTRHDGRAGGRHWLLRSAVALAVGMLFVAALAACGGDDGGDTAAEAPPAETQPAGEGAGGGDAEARALFADETSPTCASCHTLAAAGASASVGPNLDDLQPDAETVAEAIRSGPGIMPAFDQLSDEQVQQLSEYVAGVAGG